MIFYDLILAKLYFFFLHESQLKHTVANWNIIGPSHADVPLS